MRVRDGAAFESAGCACFIVYIIFTGVSHVFIFAAMLLPFHEGEPGERQVQPPDLFMLNKRRSDRIWLKN